MQTNINHCPTQTQKVKNKPKLVKKNLKKRSQTLSTKKMAREHRKMHNNGETMPISDIKNPTLRAECVNMPRPCLFVSCRHHLYLDINEETGSIKFNFPDKDIWDLEETCALDVADRGGITLEEVGSIMNLTRERIRQLELSGLEKLKKYSKGEESLEDYASWDPAQDEI